MQVGLVFLIGCFLGSPGIGEGLPLAVYRNGNGMLVQHFIQSLFRFGGRCRRLRFIGTQGLNDHIVRQTRFISGINRFRLSLKSRTGLGRFLHLAAIHSTQNRRYFIPAEIQHSQTLFLCVHDFQLNALLCGTVVGNIAGLQIQRFDLAGVGAAQPARNLTVALTGAQQRGKLSLIRFAHQPMGQYIPQVLICLVRVNGKKLCIGSISAVCPKQLLKAFSAFNTVDRIAQRGVEKLHLSARQAGNVELRIIQIDRIAHLVSRFRRVMGNFFFCNRLGCFLNRFLFCNAMFHQQFMEKFFRSGFIRKSPYSPICISVIVVNGLIPDRIRIFRGGKGITGQNNRKARLSIFTGKPFHIRNNTPDKRVIVQFPFIRQFSVHNAALGQSFPDGDRVDVVKPVLFRFGVEPVLLDELGNPALYLWPGQHRSFGAFRANRKRGLAVAAVKFMSQPCGGIFLPRMVFHVTDNSVFAFNFAIPVLDSFVDVIVRERTQHFMEPWVGLVDDFPVQALPELRHIGIEPNQLQIAGAKDDAANGGVALDHGIFMVAVTAGIAVWHILHNSGKHNGLVLLMQRLNRWNGLFRHIFPQNLSRFCVRLTGLHGIFFHQRLFRLDFLILRLFLFSKIAPFLN